MCDGNSPTVSGSDYNLGNVRLAQNQPENAAVLFRRTLLLTPNDWQAHNNLGVALLRSGQVGAAAAEFRETLPNKPAVFKCAGKPTKTLCQLGSAKERLIPPSVASPLTSCDSYRRRNSFKSVSLVRGRSVPQPHVPFSRGFQRA